MSKSKGIRQRWPKGVDQQVIDLRLQQRLTVTQIMVQLNLPRHKVLKVFRKHGITIDPEQRKENVRAARLARTVAYPPGTTEAIIELRRQGMKKRDIAARLQVPFNKVLADLQDAGLILTPEQLRQNRSTRYGDVQRSSVLELRRQGKSIDEVVSYTGVSEGSVRAFCGQAGLILTIDQRKANSGRPPLQHYGVKTWQEWADKTAAQKGGACLGFYEGNACRMTWRCKKDHVFDMLPNKVQQGQWCPKCAGVGPSKGQLEVYEFIKQYHSEAILSDRSILGRKELDVWAPSLRMGIEYNGLRWHGELENGARGRTTADYQKFLMCRDKGIRLVTIFEDEWLSKERQVKAFLKAIMRVPSIQKLNARDCEAVVGHPSARQFIEDNHLQGSVGGTHVALVHPEKGIVSAATFARVNPSHGKRRPPGTVELARYCVAEDVSVRGGLTKLIAAFSRYQPEAKLLVSYSDNRWSVGGVYEAAGFTKEAESGPGYWYFRFGSTGPRYHRWTWTKRKAMEVYGADPSLTEWEIMQANGWDRIWDCGTTTWTKSL